MFIIRLNPKLILLIYSVNIRDFCGFLLLGLRLLNIGTMEGVEDSTTNFPKGIELWHSKQSVKNTNLGTCAPATTQVPC